MVRELDDRGEGGIRTREPFGYPLSKRAHSATMRPLPTRLARYARCDSSGPYVRCISSLLALRAAKVRAAAQGWWIRDSRQGRSSLTFVPYRIIRGGRHVVRRADRADERVSDGGRQGEHDVARVPSVVAAFPR